MPIVGVIIEHSPELLPRLLSMPASRNSTLLEAEPKRASVEGAIEVMGDVEAGNAPGLPGRQTDEVNKRERLTALFSGSE